MFDQNKITLIKLNIGRQAGIVDEFIRVQRLLGHPVPKPKHKSFAYTGLIHCGQCGCSITAEEKIKKSGKRYLYYHCTKRKRDVKCSQRTITEKDLGDQISSVLDKISLPSEFVTWAKKWLLYLNDQEIRRGAVSREALQKAYNDGQAKIDRLTDMRINDLLTDAEYTVKKRELTAERTTLKERIDDSEQSADNWIERVEGTLDFSENVSTRFMEAGNQGKREVLMALGSNFILQDRILRIELHDTWKIFSKAAPQVQNDIKGLELDENGAVKEKTATFATVFPRWGRLRDDFRTLLTHAYIETYNSNVCLALGSMSSEFKASRAGNQT